MGKSVSNKQVKETLKATNFAASNQLAKKISSNLHTFTSVRRVILSEVSKEALNVASDSNVVILRKSKKDSTLFAALTKLAPFTYKAVKTDETISVEKSYNVRSLLNAAAFYAQNECAPALIDAVADQRKKEALKKAKEAVSKGAELVELLQATLQAVASDSKLVEKFNTKLEAAQKSADNKAALYELAKSL